MKNAVFLFSMVLGLNVFAQDISIDWSNKIVNDSKEVGFFEEVLGSNETTIFTLWSDGSTFYKKRKLKIVAFDKKSLQMGEHFAIKGFGDGVLDDPRYEKWKYYETAVYEDRLLVFFKQEENDIESYGALVLDANLTKKVKLKSVHEANINVKKNGTSYTQIVYDVSESENIIFVNESAGPNGNVQVQYKVANKDLELIDANQFDLPLEWDSKEKDEHRFVRGRYRMTEGGYLFVSSPTKELIGGSEKKPKYKYFNTFSIINTLTSDVKTFPLVEEETEFTNGKFHIHNNRAYIEGFYKDMSVDASDQKVNGVFHIELDMEKGTHSSLIKFPFSDEFLEAFKVKSNGKKQPGEKTQAAKTKNYLNDMIIEDMVYDEAGFKLICSIQKNITRTVCSSNGVCRTTYYCEKRGVIVLAFDYNYTQMTEEVFSRYAIYPYHDVEDVSVIPLENNTHLILFGSTAESGEEGSISSKGKSKNRSDIRDKMDYGIMNEKGVIEKATLVINKPGTPKTEIKFVDASSVYLLDGEAYVFANYKRIKTGSAISRIFLPSLAGGIRGGAFKGQFFIGKIQH